MAVVLLMAALIATVFPASASALTSTGHGTGHLWAGDGISWLGSYRLADNRLAFCLEAGKSSPVGNDYDLTTGSNALGLSKPEIARLAYIARRWASTADANTAAGAQLAVWTITGLNGHTQSYYAGRANDQRQAVLAKASQMLAEAEANATVSASSSVAIRLGADGLGSVRSDLATTLLTGRPGLVAPSSVPGKLTLTGAVFDDGLATRSIRNADIYRIRATGSGTTVTVRASVVFPNLGFDAVITVGSSGAGSQMLLFAPRSTSTSTASGTTTQVSPKPFQPRVQTQTSRAEGEAGTRIADRLHLTVSPGDGLLDEWGVHGSDPASTLPVPVTVRSSLLGPFAAPPVESADWPKDPPVVCEVRVVATTGPGDYSTPECTLPTGGYYVWVETIDPHDTPADQGRERVRSWKSPFAAATEVTRATTTPTIRTTVRAPHGDADAVVAGGCVVDELVATGLGMRGALPEVQVESILVGPLPEAPGDGQSLEAGGGFDRLPVAGRATTTLTADGTYEAPCITVRESGHYVFVFRSEGSEPEADGRQLIPAFADLVAHSSEMLRVPEPDRPVVPDKPDAPKKPVAAPHRLAFTGASGVEPTMLAAVGAISVGLTALVGTLIARAARRRLSVRPSRSERP